MGLQIPISTSFHLPDGREVIIETGKLAAQADGSVVVRCGNTMMFAVAVSATEAKEGQSFFPLSVDYQEKFAAAGRIPGNFFRRESRLSDYEILISRLVDRAIRPLFPDGYMNETQIIINLISGDKETPPDAFAALAASAAMMVSDIPFAGPISEVRVARIDGKFVVNPSTSDEALVAPGMQAIETLLRPAEPAAPDDAIALRRPRSDGRGGVLVVGVESLMTTLSRCCRPAPPDAIVGFVTRGKGVAIHRRDCANFRHMAETHSERVIDVEWGLPEAKGGKEAVYPLDVSIEAADRPALLRDVSEVFAKEKMNVIGVKTISTRDADGRTARMTFTVEAPDAAQLTQVLAQITRVPGVRHARRR